MKLRLMLFALLAATPVWGQELPFKPVPTVRVQLTDGTRKWYEPLPVRRPTTDKSFLISTLISGAATVGDCENTQYALKRPGTHEANGIFGSHPTRLVCYGITTPIAVGMGIFSWRYHREDNALADASIPCHRFIKWWLPNTINTAFHTFGTLYTLGSTHR